MPVTELLAQDNCSCTSRLKINALRRYQQFRYTIGSGLNHTIL
jgi:hypothetical protein